MYISIIHKRYTTQSIYIRQIQVSFLVILWCIVSAFYTKLFLYRHKFLCVYTKHTLTHTHAKVVLYQSINEYPVWQSIHKIVQQPSFDIRKLNCFSVFHYTLYIYILIYIVCVHRDCIHIKLVLINYKTDHSVVGRNTGMSE